MPRLAPALAASVTLLACHHGDRPAPLASAAPTTGAGPAAAGGPLTSATTLEVRDAWVGLGCTHELHATLTADGDGWRGTASLTTGWGEARARERTVVVPRTAVAALEAAAVAARGALAGEQAPTGERTIGWTDDYPSGSMTFTTPSGPRTIGFTDQWRVLQWEEGGAIAMLDKAHDLFGDGGEPSEVWAAYGGILAAIGLGPWIDEACGR